MNPNVQGPVQLAGRGYVYRPNGRYEPGEYGNVVNVDLSSRETLLPRPSVQGMWWEDNVAKDASAVIGSFGTNPILASPTVGWHLEVGSDKVRNTSVPADYTAFQTEALTVRPTVGGGTTNVRTQLLGYFTYNTIEYMIVLVSYRPTGLGPGDDNDQVGYVTVMKAPFTSFFNSQTIGNFQADFPAIASSTINDIHLGAAAYYANNLRFPSSMVHDWLVHKDRLWIVIGDTLYFSAPTEPADFRHPLSLPSPGLGGFIKFPLGAIKSLSAVGDIIYVVGDTSVHAVTYGSDPNVDLQSTVISETVGGEDSTVHGDTVYIVKPNAIFAVNGHNISRVMDLEVNLVSTDVQRLVFAGTAFTQGKAFDMKIEAFEDSLYIIPRYVEPIKFANVVDHWQLKYTFAGTSGLIKIDLNNGFVSRYEFGHNGLAVDCRIADGEDALNQTRLAFIGYGASTTIAQVFTLGNRSRYFSALSVGTGFPTWLSVENFNMDTYCPIGVANTLRSSIPGASINIASFSPDNLHHMIKKFRSIILDMNVPTRWDGVTRFPIMQLIVQAGNDSSAELSTLINTTLTSGFPGEENTAESLRYGLNQKCKLITIRFELFRFDYGVLVTSANHVMYPTWEISDVRTLWTYSGRGPTNAVGDNN